MSSLSHIFKRREPGIAFVSPWRKVSVLPVIQNNSAVHELIRTKFCSWKLGCGAPWRAITRAEGLTGEGPGVGGWGKRKEMTRFRGSAFFFCSTLYPSETPLHRITRTQMLFPGNPASYGNARLAECTASLCPGALPTESTCLRFIFQETPVWPLARGPLYNVKDKSPGHVWHPALPSILS